MKNKNMEYLKDLLEVALTMIGIFTFIYIGAYFVELAKQKVRRKMRVCDNCFEIVKKL